MDPFYNYVKEVSGTFTGGNDLAALVNAAATAGETATITLYADAPAVTTAITVNNGGTDITLVGNTATRTITSGISGSQLITVTNGALKLGNNLTVAGYPSSPTGGLVTINGGALEMLTGSEITGYNGTGNVISVLITGTFTMGGTISAINSSASVIAVNGGTASISGTITNCGSTANHVVNVISGAGLTIAAGANITNNTGTNSVVNIAGTCAITGGAITSNTTASNGAQVFVSTGGTLSLSGGRISGVINGRDDLLVSNTETVKVQGSAQVGTLTLWAGSGSSRAVITRDGPWTGGVTTLNLLGSTTPVAIVIGWWLNQPVITGLGLTSAEVALLGKGSFIASDNTTQAFTGTHHFYGTGSGENTNSDFGKLVSD